MLSEDDVRDIYISPAVKQAGWDALTQVRRQVHLTKGRIIVRGKIVIEGESKFADYILYHKPQIPLAIIEAFDIYVDGVLEEKPRTVWS